MYFFFWLFSFCFLQAMHFSVIKVPEYLGYLNTAATEFTEYYPKELIMSWDGQKLISSSETVMLHYPSFLTDKTDLLPETLGLYTSSEVNPLEDASFNNTLLVSTPTRLFLKDAETNWTEYQLTSLLAQEDSFVFTKNSAEYFLSLWQSKYSETRISGQIVGGIGFLGYTVVTTLLTVLLRTILLVLIFKISNFRSPFKAVLKLAALFTVPVLAVQTATVFIYGNDAYGISGLVFWILVFLFISSKRRTTKKASV